VAAPTPSKQLAADIVEVARLRAGLPRGEVSGEVRAFWPDEFEGLWAVPMFAGDQGRVLLIMTVDGEVAPLAGLARAAVRLRHLRLLDRPEPHPTQSVRPLLDAVGGLTPGYPRYPTEVVSRTAEGGLRLVLSESAGWVQFAASGAAGMPPSEARGPNRGVTAPPPGGQMICEIARDYGLQWTYRAEDILLGHFAGHPDEDRSDECPPIVAERLGAAARAKARSPLAVPAGPVQRHGETADAVLWRVLLLGLEPITIAERDGLPLDHIPAAG
jgi:hypothetical protein